MGHIGRLLSFLRVTRPEDIRATDAQVDTGGGVVITADNFAPAGDDSQPLPEDYALVVPTPRSGSGALAGFVDIKNEPKAGPGEKRLYARDAEGLPVCEIWLKADKSVTVVNESGSFALQADGNIVLNGVTIDPDGNISAASLSAPSVKADGKELAGHLHGPGTYSNGGGPVGGQSGPNE